MCSADMCGVCFAPLWNLFYWVSSKKSEHFTADARAQPALGVLEGSGPVNMLSNPSTCVFLWNCGRKDGIVYLVQLESDVEDDSLIIEQACQEDDTSLRVRAGSERVWVCVNYRFEVFDIEFLSKQMTVLSPWTRQCRVTWVAAVCSAFQNDLQGTSTVA